MIPGIASGFPLYAQQVARTVQRIQAILGNTIVWMGFGTDFTLTGSTIDSWPGRVGGTLTYTPNSIGRYSRGVTNGLPSSYCTADGNSNKSLRLTGSTALKSFWAVSALNVNFPNGAQNLIVPNSVNQGLIRGYYSDQVWYPQAGWTFYKDGEQTNGIELNSLHLYQGDNSSLTDTDFAVGGYVGDYTPRAPYDMPIMFGMVLNAVPSEANRLAVTNILMEHFGIVNETLLLTKRIANLVGSANITSMWIGDDTVVGTYTDITSFKARYGSNSTPVSTGRAAKGVVLNRSAAVFSAGADSMAYTAASGALTQVAICRYDGVLPVPTSQGIITSNVAPSLQTNLGTSTVASRGAIYRDGYLAAYALNSDPHMWAATNPTGSSDTFYLGNLLNDGARNWVGPIWFAAQFSTELSAGTISSLAQILQSRYPFLVLS